MYTAVFVITCRKATLQEVFSVDVYLLWTSKAPMCRGFTSIRIRRTSAKRHLKLRLVLDATQCVPARSDIPTEVTVTEAVLEKLGRRIIDKDGTEHELEPLVGMPAPCKLLPC